MPAEARWLQERLRKQVVAEDRFGPVHRVAGLDAHCAPVSRLTWAAVAVLRFPDLEPNAARGLRSSTEATPSGLRSAPASASDRCSFQPAIVYHWKAPVPSCSLGRRDSVLPNRCGWPTACPGCIHRDWRISDRLLT